MINTLINWLIRPKYNIIITRCSDLKLFKVQSDIAKYNSVERYYHFAVIRHLALFSTTGEISILELDVVDSNSGVRLSQDSKLFKLISNEIAKLLSKDIGIILSKRNNHYISSLNDRFKDKSKPIIDYSMSDVVKEVLGKSH